MTPKLTKQMEEAAIADGAEVTEKKEKRKVAKPVRRPAPPTTPINKDHTAEIEALRDEIAGLKVALEAERTNALRASQDITRALEALSENKPLRLKPIRDMDPQSKTYLLVEYYDFVPVTYQPRKLNS